MEEGLSIIFQFPKRVSSPFVKFQGTWSYEYISEIKKGTRIAHERTCLKNTHLHEHEQNKTEEND